MTPAARVQAAIEILDRVLAGAPAEQALTGWARGSRYAGSKDRAAVRDHVFDALRCLRSLAALGGARSGRGLMLGALRRDGGDPGAVFCDAPYAPPPLSPAERAAGRVPVSAAERLDIPDWLWPRFLVGLGAAAEPAARALQRRAPVHLRVNLGKARRAEARHGLAGEGIECIPHPAAQSALEVIRGGRRIRRSNAYRGGAVELQDAASQAVVEALPLEDGMRVLDFCAGGGGKALAMAARARLRLFVHDAAPQRMRDLPARARRAGVRATRLSGADLAAAAPFDLVLCDAPCSGSGAWRRAPEGKWRLTPARLEGLVAEQARILGTAASLTAPDGVLAYATCSVLDEENDRQIARFMDRTGGWHLRFRRVWALEAGTDGFFAAHLTRAANIN